LNKSSDDFEANSDESVHELGKGNTRVLLHQSNIIELRSGVETKSFQKEDEIKQSPVNENNFLADICA
jgi:hypothetical protein